MYLKHVLAVVSIIPAFVVAGEPVVADQSGALKNRTAWYFFFDNDKLASLTDRDRDYTGGFAIARVSEDYKDSSLYFERGLLWLDNLSPGNIEASSIVYRGMEFAASAFTPENIETPEPIYNDRPYASVLSWVQSRSSVRQNNNSPSLSTATLSLGLLGTRVGEYIQDVIHEVTPDPNPNGWQNQISDGGEPTFRVGFYRQRLHKQHGFDGDYKFEVSGLYKINVGYLTDAGVGGVLRWGRLRSPWWLFAPLREEYAEKSPSPLPHRSALNEWYVWGGVFGRLRLYNVLLQGQFRESKVTFSSDQLSHLLGDLKGGVVFRHQAGWELGCYLSWQSSEFKEAPADRDISWGTIYVALAL
ncbi:lipid A deacylase LpxR family protein [Kaarinaea lacus]